MLMGVIVGPPAAPIIFKVPLMLVMLISSHAWVSYGGQDKSSDALLKFKSTLSYAKGFDSWNPSTPPCSGDQGRWHGVLCTDGAVWGLQLENMNLSGEIDVDSLLPLTSLRTISLTQNSFWGPMPDWRKLGALKSLFLSNNHFSGQIPDDAFSNMSSLKKVYLANNNFVGAIPSSLATPRLLELRLENNGFTGPLPNFKPGLRELNVSNNKLEGPIPQALSKLNPNSFVGNKDLCGKPLESPCNSLGPLPDEKPSSPVQPPTTPTSSSSSTHTQDKKPSLVRIIFVVIAVVLALAAILVFLAICRRSTKRRQPRLGRVVSSFHKQNSMSNSTVGFRGKSAQMGGAESKALPRMNSSSKKSDQPSKLAFVRNDRQRFDLHDLLRASAEVLGSGNFGSSYKAVLMDGQAVVVKRFKQMNNVGKEEFQEHMRRLGRLVHPNLLPLVAFTASFLVCTSLTVI